MSRTIKLVLGLMLSISPVATFADDGVIFSDDLQWASIINKTTTSINNWSLDHCWFYNRNPDYAISLEGNSSAISPELDKLLGNASFSFEYSKSNTSSGDGEITVELLNGLFEDGTIKKSVKSSEKSFKEISFVISGNSSTQIKFGHTSSSLNVAFDNVLVTIPKGILSIILNETANNVTTTNTHANEIADVTLTRTLRHDIWNTLCLPFHVNLALMEQALGSGKDIQMRTFSSYNATDRVMSFVEVGSNQIIEAGTPFLIKFSSDSDVDNPTFNVVTIQDTDAKTITYNGISFIGTYSPVRLSSSDVFIGIDNKLYNPQDDGQTMNGMRAYFQGIPSSPSGIRLFLDGISDGIQGLQTSVTVDDGSYYSLSGVRMAKPAGKGIYVKNAKKIIVK